MSYWARIASLCLSVIISHIASPSGAQTWALTGAMNTERFDHTTTLLLDGRVLVTGGRDQEQFNRSQTGQSFTGLASAEIYDPTTGTWSATGAMGTGRMVHNATLLQDGRVLITGGLNGRPTGSTLFIHNTAEIYDPNSGTFTPTGPMNVPRNNHAAVLLPDGKVLVAGGSDVEFSSVASAELYDPTAGNFTFTGSMNRTRHLGDAVLLLDGTVIYIGGNTNYTSPTETAEIYDPNTGAWVDTGSMVVTKFGKPTATLLGTGEVLIAGGFGAGIGILASAELYDPATGTFALTGSMAKARFSHAAARLQDGGVLVVGGQDLDELHSSAEVYDQEDGTWAAAGSMNVPRYAPTATSLPNGQVLVVGGFDLDGSQVLASAELFGAAVRLIGIDIKPGSFPNNINPKSQGKTLVAILSSASFDAVAEVDAGSLTFGQSGDEASLFRCNPAGEDVNADGLLDLVCHFYNHLTGFQAGDTAGVLKGTASGTQIRGSDSVRVIAK